MTTEETTVSNQPKVTIKSEVQNRSVNTKNGPKTIYWQDAQLETEQMRIKIEVECDGPNMGHPNGKTFDWDVVADLVPGNYGPQLARRMSLVDAVTARQVKAA